MRIIEESREEIQVGGAIQTEFKVLVDTIIGQDKPLCAICVIIGRPTSPGGCNHNLGSLETRPGYLNHQIIWEQSYFEKCPQCQYHLLPLQHCQVCKQCFRIPKLHNRFKIPDRDVDVCDVCPRSPNALFVWQLCIIIPHVLLATMGGRNKKSLPTEIYCDLAMVVREMWVQDLRERFNFGDDDLAPFHFRYYDKQWTVWLLSSP